MATEPNPPVLTVYPELEVFTTGDNVTLRCNFTYPGNALYSFYLNDVLLEGDKSSDTMSIASVKPSDSGQYYCIAKASGGNILLFKSNIIEFTVQGKLHIPKLYLCHSQRKNINIT